MSVATTQAVLLNPDWPATFRRSVRDENGKTLKVLEFKKGEPLLLDEAEFEAVINDLGKSLCFAHLDSDGVPTGKPAKEQ
jgi:hypothetical protein